MSIAASFSGRIVRVVGLLAALVAVAWLLGGCAMSREQQLRAKSRAVEAELNEERARVLKSASPDRAARLSHLTTLRGTLSAANLGLATIPVFVPEPQRPMAYDVLEEVYATISWNAPLGPNQPQKALPKGFAGGTLRVDELSGRGDGVR